MRTGARGAFERMARRARIHRASRAMAARRRPWLVAAALATLACGDQGPPVPGAYTVEVVSPNAAEGAARVTLLGQGIRSVSADGGWVFHHVVDTVATVLVVNDAPGSLRFRVETADAALPLTGTVDEVAGPDDALRPATSAYLVSVTR